MMPSISASYDHCEAPAWSAAVARADHVVHDAPLRIAVLAPGYGLVVRGVEVFVHNLMTRLAERHPNWHFDIYARASSQRLSPNSRVRHVPAVPRDSAWATWYARVLHRLRVYWRTRLDAECLSYAVALAPALWRRRYDVVYNQAGWFAGHLLAAKRRRDGTPFVHTTAAGYSELEIKLARQRPDFIFATSPPVLHLLQQAGPVRGAVVPNAVDTTKFRPLHASRRDPRPQVLCVGALDAMKRCELTIRAAARLPHVQLQLVGEGPERATLEQLGEQLLGREHFRLLGRVPNDQLPELYNACDVFTLASDEPFGIVFLEAMACNRPVVARDTPVTNWIVQEAGITCACDDLDAYAAAIQRALVTDFRDRPRRRAQNFGWEPVVEQYERVFAGLRRLPA